MKKYSLIMIFILLLVSCEEDLLVFDNINGQTAVSFGTTTYNLSVPEEGAVVEIPVNVTTLSESDRSFNVTVDESSIGSASNYSIGQLTVPANSYNAILDVNLNFDALVDGEVYELNLNLEAPADGVAFDNSVTIEYFKVIVCNDVLVTINTDLYGDETTWEITNDADEVVATGGPYDRGVATYEDEVFLEDGCYTFTIFDAYADGQQDGTVVGSASIDCSILNLLTAGGEFEASQSTEFCVNQ